MSYRGILLLIFIYLLPLQLQARCPVWPKSTLDQIGLYIGHGCQKIGSIFGVRMDSCYIGASTKGEEPNYDMAMGGSGKPPKYTELEEIKILCKKIKERKKLEQQPKDINNSLKLKQKQIDMKTLELTKVKELISGVEDEKTNLEEELTKVEAQIVTENNKLAVLETNFDKANTESTQTEQEFFESVQRQQQKETKIKESLLKKINEQTINYSIKILTGMQDSLYDEWNLINNELLLLQSRLNETLSSLSQSKETNNHSPFKVLKQKSKEIKSDLLEIKVLVERMALRFSKSLNYGKDLSDQIKIAKNRLYKKNHLGKARCTSFDNWSAVIIDNMAKVKNDFTSQFALVTKSIDITLLRINEALISQLQLEQKRELESYLKAWQSTFEVTELMATFNSYQIKIDSLITQKAYYKVQEKINSIRQVMPVIELYYKNRLIGEKDLHALNHSINWMRNTLDAFQVEINKIPSHKWIDKRISRTKRRIRTLNVTCMDHPAGKKTIQAIKITFMKISNYKNQSSNEFISDFLFAVNKQIDKARSMCEE